MTPELALALVLDAQVRIERCWHTSRSMRAEVSEEAVEAYVTKCLGAVLADCETRPLKGGPETWVKQ